MRKTNYFRPDELIIDVETEKKVILPKVGSNTISELYY